MKPVQSHGQCHAHRDSRGTGQRGSKALSGHHVSAENTPGPGFRTCSWRTLDPRPSPSTLWPLSVWSQGWKVPVGRVVRAEGQGSGLVPVGQPELWQRLSQAAKIRLPGSTARCTSQRRGCGCSSGATGPHCL